MLTRLKQQLAYQRAERPAPRAQHPTNRVVVCASTERDIEAASDVGWLWDTRAALRSIQARPKKALGQNFISDPNILERVVKKGSITEDDIIIEIGPGTGNLTQHLLKVLILMLLFSAACLFVPVIVREMEQMPSHCNISALTAGWCDCACS
jgi:hypothetical protein